MIESGPVRESSIALEQETVKISLWQIEANALKRFYSEGASCGERVKAALMIIPSLLVRRAGKLAIAQEYADRGVVFRSGENEILVDETSLEVNEALQSKQRLRALEAVVGVILGISAGGGLVVEGLQGLGYMEGVFSNRAAFIYDVLIFCGGGLLLNGAMTWLEIANHDQIVRNANQQLTLAMKELVFRVTGVPESGDGWVKQDMESLVKRIIAAGYYYDLRTSHQVSIDWNLDTIRRLAGDYS